MAKSSVVGKTIRGYSDASTVHGISYISLASVPVLDRLIWAVLTITSLSIACYLSVIAHRNWQDGLVTTNLKDAAKPVASLPFPAVTICRDGLDMEAVKDQLFKDFNMWKREENKTSTHKEEDEKFLQEFMKLKFGILDIRRKNIFDLLKSFHSPDPEATSKSLFTLQISTACAKEKGADVHGGVSQDFGEIKLNLKICKCRTPSSGCIIEDDINYPGNDLRNQTVESQQACADLCASTVEGFFWVWNKVGDNVCYVKSSTSERENNIGSMAGNRNCGRGKIIQR